ncbi:hypothetical protein MBLNU459_g3429t1 [Dothideomycetes sp. NU459]
MSWRPVKDLVYAVCIQRFEATEPNDLNLDIGDDVYITEVGGPTQEWCRGWLVAQPSILTALTADTAKSLKSQVYSGVFPRNCVKIREVLADDAAARTNGEDEAEHLNGTDVRAGASRHSQNEDHVVDDTQEKIHAFAPGRGRPLGQTILVDQRPRDLRLRVVDVPPRNPKEQKDKAPLPSLRIGDATAYSAAEPLVDEISSCLREWHSTKLHGLVLGHEYQLLDQVSSLVQRLDNSRKQLLHDLLTEQELVDARERIIWDLVDGNKLLDGDVIVRSPREKGRILTARDSISEMLKLQAMMSLRNRPPPKPLDEPHISHVLAQIQQFPEMPGDPGVLHMYLCHQAGDARPRPVSEVFAVEVPFDDDEGSASSSRLARTLFTDLTKAEIGSATNASSRLYLVCILQREEPIRAAISKRAATPTPSLPRSENLEQLGDKDGGNGGRRSFFFGSQRSRKALERSVSQDRMRPPTAESTRSKLQAPRAYTPTSLETQSRPSTAEKRVRRVVGYSAVEIGALVRQNEHATVSMALWTPAQPLDDVVCEHRPGEEGWEDILKLLARSPTDQFAKASAVGAFSLDLHAFAHTNSEVLIKDNPALLREVHCTQPLGISSAPAHPRSDVYLTLREPILPHNTHCFHPQDGSVPIAAVTGLRNLQLTLEVRTSSGKRIENAIWPTSNRPPHTAFRTPAIERGEAWNQTIRLSVPDDELSQAHIVMSIADGNNFPFALAWIPLWNRHEERCPHGQQVLALWDYSEFTASTVHGRGAYQSLPSHLSQLNTQDKNVMAALSVELSLSSSTNPQDPYILALLNWDGTTVEGLMDVLEGFKTSSDDEIMKFFKPIVAALDRVFNVFYGLIDDSGTDMNIGEAFPEHALSCIVHVLHLTKDRRYNSARTLLEDYLLERRPSAGAAKSACRAFKAFLGRPYEAGDARELRYTLKVSPELIRFIAHNGPAPPQSNMAIAKAVQSVRLAATNLMRNPLEALVPTQTMLMQQFADWLPELLPVMAPEEILDFADEMMLASVQKKGTLRITRLVMIRHLASLGIFVTQDVLSKFLALTKDWLESYWIEADEVTQLDIDGIRMCCSIIESQQEHMTIESTHYISKLFETYALLSKDVSHPSSQLLLQKRGKDVLSLPFPKTYPFPNISTDSSEVPNEALLEIVAVLGCFFQRSVPQGDIPTGDTESEAKVTQEKFISRALQTLRSIQRGELFPPQWLSFYVTHTKYAVAMLEWFLDMLIANFIPADDDAGISDILSFNTELWEQWFQTITEIALCKSVSLESFSEQTRRAIWTVGGDVRRSAADLLRRGWSTLGWKVAPEYEKVMFPIDQVGGYQVGLTSKLVPFAVSLSMCLHHELRSVGQDMLRSMIVSEWQLNENLDILQSAFFDSFETMHQQDGSISKAYISTYLERLGIYLQIFEDTTERELYDAVSRLVRDVEKLLDALSNLSTVTDPASQLIQIVRLMDFLHVSGREEAYVRRVHDLVQRQKHVRNYSSAASAIQLHIDVLDRNHTDPRGSRILEELNLPGLYLPSESAVLRKNRLYRLMATYYEKGSHWEKVLDNLRQLADGHRIIWDIVSLADIRNEEARIYNRLATESLHAPRYFHVRFNDDDQFPESLRGRAFIFEGPAKYDRRSFTAALHVQFPYAVNLTPDYSHPTPQTVGPALRVSPVTPFKPHLHPINQQSGIVPQYREHCLTSRATAFAITNRHDVPQLSVTDQIVEKTVYTTRNALPTLLSYSEIVNEEKVTLTPLQAAIDRTQRKTLIVVSIAQLAADRGESQTETLIETIRSSVDPGSNGSVAEYHKLLQAPFDRLSAGSTMAAESFVSAVSAAAQGLENGALVSEDLLLRRALAVALEDHARALEAALASALIQAGVKKDLRDAFEDSFALELNTLYPAADWRVRSPAWVEREPPQQRPALDQFQQQSSDARNNSAMSMREGEPEPVRKRSTGRRYSLRRRLSFLSISGRSIIKDN